MILVYGTVCLDRVRHVRSLPPLGGYSEILEETDHLGGEASNTSVALARWGSDVRLFANAIGQGPSADFVIRQLMQNGLTLSSPLSNDRPAPYCEIYVTDDGERTMFGYGFLQMHEEVDPSTVPYEAGGWFTADRNHGDAANRAVSLAAEQGMSLYLLDFVYDEDLRPPGSIIQSSTDHVGSHGNTQRNLEWVSAFAQRTKCTTILSDGPNGFCVGDPSGESYAFPPFPCPTMVDSTGAGDVFRAGMLYGLDQGWSLPGCFRFASAAGCLNCRSWGGNAGVPHLDEVRDLIAKNPRIAKQYEIDFVNEFASS